MITRDFSWDKGGRCVELTTYHPCSAENQEIRDLNLPGTPWATFTLLYFMDNFGVMFLCEAFYQIYYTSKNSTNSKNTIDHDIFSAPPITEQEERYSSKTR
jgi:hypothetical protein